MSPDDTILREVRQRVTRIESRLCRIADHLGAHVGTPSKELCLSTRDGTLAVTTPAMDVTLSELLQFLTSQGVAGKVVFVRFAGRTVATIHT